MCNSTAPASLAPERSAPSARRRSWRRRTSNRDARPYIQRRRFRAVRVPGPACAGRHDVAMSVERDRRPGPEFPRDDQIGRRNHAVAFDQGVGNLVALDGEAETLEQLGDSLRRRRTIARRVVGGRSPLRGAQAKERIMTSARDPRSPNSCFAERGREAASSPRFVRRLDTPGDCAPAAETVAKLLEGLARRRAPQGSEPWSKPTAWFRHQI